MGLGTNTALALEHMTNVGFTLEKGARPPDKGKHNFT